MTTKVLKLLATLWCLIATLPGQITKPLTARDYYNELVKANALEKFASHVCFSDKDDGTFWTFIHFGWNPSPSENAELRALQEKSERGEYNHLTKELQATWDRGLLHVVTYWKGVPHTTDLLKDGDSWTSVSQKENGNGLPPTVFKFTMQMNWKTLRYVRLPLEMCMEKNCQFVGEVESGRCEILPVDVPILEKQ